MLRWVKYHGLQVLVAVAVLAAAFHADRTWFSADNLGVVAPGKLIRSPQPRGQGWRMLGRFGVNQVINLRTRAENPAELAETLSAARAAGATMTHIPIAARLPNSGQIEDFLFAARREGVTSLVHCQHGEDRTGMLVAAYRVVVDGWPVRKAVAEMIRYRDRPDRSDLRLLRQMLHTMRIRRAWWLRRTDPTNVWVRREEGGDSAGIFQLADARDTLYMKQVDPG